MQQILLQYLVWFKYYNYFNLKVHFQVNKQLNSDSVREHC